MGIKQADWLQRWWWRERLSGVIGIAVVVLLAVATWWGVAWFSRDDDSRPNYGYADDAKASSSSSVADNGPKEKPPKLPQAAHEKNEEGIRATIRFHNDALNYLQRTGDAEPLRQIFDMDACAACKLFIERFSGLASRGRHLEGADYRIQDIGGIVERDTSSRWDGYGFYSSEQPTDYYIVDKDGNKLEKRERQKLSKFSLVLTYYGHWIIASSDVAQ